MTQQLGHYEIVSELGRGGMGVVLKGYEPALARYVAIKQLSPALSHDPNLVERFLREARSMAALNDPHILQVYFIGQESGQPFFVMEFVEGESVAQLIKRQGRLPIADTLKILLQAARGLATAHERNVIHRDIKPANLMLDLRGRLKVADFGIALARGEFDTKLTGTGEFVGTPGYLSPEICLGKPVDARSDLFALGIVMFECLTGRLPFSDESPLKLMLDVVQAEIPDIRALNAEVDPDTARILSKLVAKEPSDRYASAQALAEELEAHPLIAGKGTALGLAILKPSAGPAATMIMSTPAQPQTRRAPTPPPNVAGMATGSNGVAAPPPPPAAAEAPTAVPTGAATVVNTPVQSVKQGSKAPMVVALSVGALMVAALGYGGFRLWQGNAAAPAETAETTTETPTDTGAPPTTPPSDGTTTAQMPPTDPAATADALPSGKDPGGKLAAAAAAGAAAGAVGTANATATPNEMPVPPPSMPDTPAVASEPAIETRAAPVREAIAERREERRAATSIAVVGNGDPAIVGPVVQAVEEAAASRGWDIIENPSGADRVVRVNVEQTGTQQLNYYGQSSEMVIAQVSVRMFGPGGRALGPGFRQRVQYTALNADAMAQQAVQGRLSGLVGDPER